MEVCFLVLARDRRHLDTKINELEGLDMPYLVVCGEKVNHPNVFYREPKGKYDAINFGVNILLQKNPGIIILNDVDTRINNFNLALNRFKQENAALLFVRVKIAVGPQKLFYALLDAIRKRFLVVASGELMLIDSNFLRKVIPIPPCKTEDNYILFKILEMKGRTIFCNECFVETERTKTAEKEAIYKRKTVTGLYQALSYTKPPIYVRLFFTFLPFLTPLLLVSGKKGYYWEKGIMSGFLDYLRGDRGGTWKTDYMQ
jgi:cellulose synthase/poly-beta-1,6-N-acetylglucosamine synthase-like glycosyltransferase